ncbi:MAG TPA: BACON domain-containing carbohydrate-binding protein [Blastocatellia bacterium]|nr:BACON domain-containing carbohydrate-binding protein [Blastocatellia bacterium]
MLYIKSLFAVALLGLAGALILKQTESLVAADAGHPRRDERIVVRANNQRDAGINLGDGRQLMMAYTGPAESKNDLEQGLARPLALSSADYDEDGVADLVSGYAGTKGGIITLMRGNLDAIHPNGPEAQRRRAQGAYTDDAFLSPARVFELKSEPDFIAAGDFDADGHWDVAAAERGGDSLFLLRGSGAGDFSLPEEIHLPGRVTAMAEGEINRADGLTDLVVAVVKDSAATALVFEGPSGALRAEPEAISLPSEASSLALGRTDGDGWIDLVIAAGRELLSVRGRDRKLSLDEVRRAEVRPANIDRQSFPFSIRSVAVGDFDGDNSADVALLADEGAIHLVGAKTEKRARAGRETLFASGRWPMAARLIRAGVSTAPADSLMLIDSNSSRLHIVSGERQAASLDVEGGAVAVHTMRLNSDALSDLVILGKNNVAPAIVKSLPSTIFTVTNASDSGPGSLRQAILDANANPGADTINFSINSGVQTITIEKPLPAITQALTIDGTTQPGFSGSPIVELNGNEISTDGLTVEGGNSSIRGLVINRFRGCGISLWFTGNNVVSGNFIGTNIAGNANLENLAPSVCVESGNNNLVGGTTLQARNLLAPTQSAGVSMSKNVMNTLVQGNIIGADITGTVSLSTSSAGVSVFGASNNVIGGTTAGAGNLISGNTNSTGVSIRDEGNGIGGSGNLVQGNLIGTNGAGTSALRNNGGVSIGDVPDNTVGGTTVSARNVISGNTFGGVSVGGDDATGTLVQGNYIGTNAAGTAALGNGLTGIDAGVLSGCTIGGTAAGAGNVISGNSAGIFLGNLSKGNSIQGNFIGTNAAGTAAIANTTFGIIIDNAITNLIGGTSPGARNVISGNRTGLRLSGSNPTTNVAVDNAVQGNFIGTDVSGTAALGNLDDGVIISFANSNTIGGAGVGMANIIAFNGRHGVNIVSNSRNSVLSNSIFSNQGMGINLGFSDEATPNDPCDGDPGPNNLQNFPVINSASSAAGSTMIQGTLNSSANMTYTIEFFVNASCDGSGLGEGQSLIGSTVVTTDAGCNASFNVTFPVSTTGFITATATDSLGSTSEFSQCRQLPGSCSYSIAPSSGFFTEIGGEGSFIVLAPQGCNWTAVANDPWITITSADGGAGIGGINYLVRENPGGAGRQGTIQVAGLTFTINQRGRAGEACTFTLSRTFGLHGAAGGGGSFNVVTQPGCAWQATAAAGWVTITSNSSGIGPGAVTYSVTTNLTLAHRKTTITAGGETFSIKQLRN